MCQRTLRPRGFASRLPRHHHDEHHRGLQICRRKRSRRDERIFCCFARILCGSRTTSSKDSVSKLGSFIMLFAHPLFFLIWALLFFGGCSVVAEECPRRVVVFENNETVTSLLDLATPEPNADTLTNIIGADAIANALLEANDHLLTRFGIDPQTSIVQGPGIPPLPINNQGFAIFPFRFTNPYKVIVDTGGPAVPYDLEAAGIVAVKLPGTPPFNYGGSFAAQVCVPQGLPCTAQANDIIFGKLVFSLPPAEEESSSEVEGSTIFNLNSAFPNRGNEWGSSAKFTFGSTLEDQRPGRIQGALQLIPLSPTEFQIVDTTNIVIC